MPILDFELSAGRWSGWWPSSDPTAKARDFSLFEDRRAAGLVADGRRSI